MTATVTSGDRSTVTYVNDTNKSLVTKVTDPMNNVTSYGYDTMRRQTSVTQGSSTLNYTYTDDLLTSITHSGGTNTTYSFEYGPAGLTSKVKVGTQALVTNTYDTNKWLLTSQAYGNGDVWSYEYTDYNDLESKTSGNQTFKYFYNNEGAVARIEQWTGSALTGTERYYYDIQDRLSRLVELNGSGEVTHEYKWTYDHNNCGILLCEEPAR